MPAVIVFPMPQPSLRPIRSSRPRRTHRIHLMPAVFGIVVTAAAIVAVGYLLRPTWQVSASNDPGRIPVSIGGTVFNVPTRAIRMKVQRHSGPQDRVDLSFEYPSLAVPPPANRVTARTIDAKAIDDATPAGDRIFLSIATGRDDPSPDELVRSVYPHYVDAASLAGPDGLTQQPFRAGTPYGSEDLFSAGRTSFVARCSRDAATPGMCLVEKRIDGADLTFRFPRAWLDQWKTVASAMDRLVGEITRAHS